MTLSDEADARVWIAALPNVPRETWQRLDVLAEQVTVANADQNLIAGATVPHIWVRHIADSAQLLVHAADDPGPWLDIGSGAGFPGLVIAAMVQGPVTLAEPRRLRAEFLAAAAASMGIDDRVTVVQAKAEKLPPADFGTISARAVAPLSDLLAMCAPFSTEKTRLVLPKGRNVQSELAEAQRLWQGDFRLEPSITDDEAQIVVVEGFRRRNGRAGR